jgi:hypothetical protein
MDFPKEDTATHEGDTDTDTLEGDQFILGWQILQRI